MSLQGALRELLEHKNKTEKLIEALMGVANQEEEAPQAHPIEARVVQQRRLPTKTSKRLGSKGTPLATRLDGQPFARNFKNWCDNPDCPHNHAKGQPDATKFAAASRRNHYCTTECRQANENRLRRKKQGGRAQRRAKVGLKVHGNTGKRRGRPPKTSSNGSGAHSLNTGGTNYVKAGDIPPHRMECEGCHRGFMAEGRKKFCPGCTHDLFSSNAAFARARKHGQSVAKVHTQLLEIWGDRGIPPKIQLTLTKLARAKRVAVPHMAPPKAGPAAPAPEPQPAAAETTS